MLVSTLLLLVLSLTIALPTGICSAIYLSEYAQPQQKLYRVIRHTLNTLAAIPSIVMGMFGFAFFVVVLHMGFSILSGALTLSLMILPLLIRNIEDSLRHIPLIYRQNALALGLSKTRTIFQILLPQVRHSIFSAIILASGRAMAETAALLFTAGYVMRMPDSIMDSGRSLSVHIFDLVVNVPGGEDAAYGSAVVLLCFILLINLLTNSLDKQFKHRV